MTPKHQTLCFQAAKRCADWFVKNQVQTDFDANCGRYRKEYNFKKKHWATHQEGEFSTNWITSLIAKTMIMVHERTGQVKYLNSARLAIRYVQSLQVSDKENPKIDGTIREHTPLSAWCHPRDALSGAWGLLHAGIAWKDKDLVERAIRFASWFKKNALRKGYPAYSFCIEPGAKPIVGEGVTDLFTMGSFHGGSPAFFLDLYEQTGDEVWLKKVALPILDTFVKHFIKRDGSLHMLLDPKTRKTMDHKTLKGKQCFHQYNDDFAALANLKAFRITGKEKYLVAAKNFLDWAVKIQADDGSFGTPPVNSGAGVLLVELQECAKLTGEKKYLLAAEGAARYLIGEQQVRDKRVAAYGGFWGLTAFQNLYHTTLNERASCYALAGLLKMESKQSYKQYSA